MNRRRKIELLEYHLEEAYKLDGELELNIMASSTMWFSQTLKKALLTAICQIRELK